MKKRKGIQGNNAAGDDSPSTTFWLAMGKAMQIMRVLFRHLLISPMVWVLSFLVLLLLGWGVNQFMAPVFPEGAESVAWFTVLLPVLVVFFLAIRQWVCAWLRSSQRRTTDGVPEPETRPCRRWASLLLLHNILGFIAIVGGIAWWHHATINQTPFDSMTWLTVGELNCHSSNHRRGMAADAMAWLNETRPGLFTVLEQMGTPRAQSDKKLEYIIGRSQVGCMSLVIDLDDHGRVKEARIYMD